MHLTLLGQHSPDALETTLHVDGDTLTINDTAHDLSVVPEGGEAIDDDIHSPFVGPIRRIAGVIHARVRVGFDSTADLSGVSEWVVEDASGYVAVPVARKPEPQSDPEPEAEE